MSNNSVVSLPLSQGRVATIDAADFERVGRVKWSLLRKPSGKFYAHRNVPGWTTQRLLHRALFRGLKPEELVRHINGDGLDCRRENLRIFTKEKRVAPVSRKKETVRNVSWYKRTNRWRARIKKHHLGYFDSEADANLAYDNAIIHLTAPVTQPNIPHV